MITNNKLLIDKINSAKAHVGVIGLGYVGLPLAASLAAKGFKVTGIDVDSNKVDKINRRENYIADVDSESLRRSVEKGNLKASCDFSVLSEIDVVVICVPTPLNKTGDPDITFIVNARDEIVKYLHSPQLVILESTTYPGTVEELILPELKKSGLEVGKDFFLAFSPERIDPNNPEFNVENTPKVVGGVTPACTEAASALYESLVGKVIKVSSPATAEMVKLLENTFRSINIGLANEISIMCKILKLDVWEVINAAATKPFGFMPFYPGPGLGGHCIPIDPSYLSWKLRSLNYRTRFIDLATEINTSMPLHVFRLAMDTLNEEGKALKGSKILLLGAAYKRDIDDIRESPALDVLRLLSDVGADICYHDPHVQKLNHSAKQYHSVELTPVTLKAQDLVIIVTDHSSVDYQSVCDYASLVLDTRNATKAITRSAARIVKL